MPEPLQERVKKLVETEEYKRQKISQEGYGSLISSPSSQDDVWMQAEKLKNKAEAMSGPESLPIFIDALCHYIRSQVNIKSNGSRFISRQAYICKFLDGCLACARKHNRMDYKDVLKWALFNLKLHALFKQGGTAFQNINPSLYAHVMKELEFLEILSSSSNLSPYEVLPMNRLEQAIRDKLSL